MKKFKNIYCLLFILFIFVGCSTNSKEVEFFDQYKDSYVGDNSAVGSIIRQLPHSEYFNGFELKTTEEPYGIIIKYDRTNEAVKETMIYNATFIFSLVKNADWITFNFGNQSHMVTRKELQEWYGKELDAYTNEEALIKIIDEHLQDKDKINKLF